MKSVKDWENHWNSKGSIENPIEINGYCIGGKPISDELYYQAVIHPTIVLLELEPHHHVLDIGCGSGMFLREIEKKVKRCVGTDISQTLLKGYSGLCETIVCAADALPFNKDEFDRILMYSVAHYFPSFDYFRKVVSDGLRFLRKEGIFVIGDLPFGIHDHYYYYDKHELMELLDSLNHPYTVAVQNNLKRKINRRYDIIIYKD